MFKKWENKTTEEKINTIRKTNRWLIIYVLITALVNISNNLGII